MQAQDNNSSVVRSFIEAINNRQLDRATAYIDDNVDWIAVGPDNRFHSPQDFRQYAQSWWNAFPDVRVEITNLFASGGYVCAEWINRGTFTGPLDWPAGKVQPTGRKLEEPACAVFSIRNGKIVSAHEYHDMATIMNQLGIPIGLRKAA